MPDLNEPGLQTEQVKSSGRSIFATALIVVNALVILAYLLVLFFIIYQLLGPCSRVEACGPVAIIKNNSQALISAFVAIPYSLVNLLALGSAGHNILILGLILNAIAFLYLIWMFVGMQSPNAIFFLFFLIPHFVIFYRRLRAA